MEVICKRVTAIINCCLRMVITFHNVLQWFCDRRGMGIAYIEANLLQHLADIREEFLCEILLTYISLTMPYIETGVLASLRHT